MAPRRDRQAGPGIQGVGGEGGELARRDRVAVQAHRRDTRRFHDHVQEMLVDDRAYNGGEAHIVDALLGRIEDQQRRVAIPGTAASLHQLGHIDRFVAFETGRASEIVDLDHVTSVHRQGSSAVHGHGGPVLVGQNAVGIPGGGIEGNGEIGRSPDVPR